jgi:hypothetical protein
MPAHPVDGQIQELARGRVDPVGVLEHHEHRPVLRYSTYPKRWTKARFSNADTRICLVKFSTGGGSPAVVIRDERQIDEAWDTLRDGTPGLWEDASLLIALLRPQPRW